ncbi:voltage-dependent calcium channel subunit alpha-2/delta-3-like isoform X3 [Clytia hemisphaerica]
MFGETWFLVILYTSVVIATQANGDCLGEPYCIQGFLNSFGHLKNRFSRSIREGKTMQKYLHPSGICRTFVDDLYSLLKEKQDEVDNIKQGAQDLEESYLFDEEIEPFNYFHRKNDPPNLVGIHIPFSLQVAVNITRSHVQVPTEIFKNDKQVLNNARMSEGLDETFMSNYAKDPALLWQYFCSEAGVHRVFPGENSNRKIDLYDCRRRLWYNQAINSPKDVVILMDMSGSMTGAHFKISKLIVQSLLDTLQQDDFFNVLYFNQATGFLIDCLNDTLAQATSYNKNQFKQAVTRLQSPKSVANFPTALKKAFRLINKVSTHRATSSSSCNKVIMLISDGIDFDEHTHEILDDENAEKEVVIFSYIVGQSTDEGRAEMKDIACQSGGEHYDFPTVGNVLDGVLKYQKRLSQPLGQSLDDHVIFTPLYLDGSGLGMMTTISTAVFSNKNGSDTRELIGVAGMDIVVSLLQQQYPVQKMGVFGHAFAINNNGLFLMHPKFKDQSGYLPDPATVYLDEVEFTTNPSKGIELKRAMINNETGCMSAEADWLFPKHSSQRVVRLNNTYCYRPMEKTPFFAGVSMPQQNAIQMVADKTKAHLFRRSGINALHSDDPNVIIEVAEWSFCDIRTEGEKKQPASIKYYPTAEDLYQYLKNNDEDLDEKCDEEMLLTLLLSASVVANFTRDHWSVEELTHNNITDAYIITSSGFTYILSTDVNNTKRLDRDIFEEIRFTHPASFYQKEFHNQLTFSVDIKSGKPQNLHDKEVFNDEEIGNIAIGKSVYTGDENTMLGVVGMSVRVDFMNRIMHEAAQNITDSDCSKNSSQKCYLIDENGYIVATNRPVNRVGYFLGWYEGQLIEDMEKREILEVREYNDTQAECPQQSDTSSSSPANILKTFYYTVFQLVYNVLAHTLAITWWMLTSLLTVSMNAIGVSAASRNVSCTKTIEIYLLKNRSIDTEGAFNCSSNCSQKYIIQSIPDTNLAQVIINNNCRGADECPLFSKNNEPKRTRDLTVCEQPLRYRRALSVCYKLTGEDKRACFDVNENKESNIIIYLIVFISICFAIIIAISFNMYFRKYFHGRCM